MIFSDALIPAIVLCASAATIAVLQRSASRMRIMDVPNDRSLHAQPIPRTGGIGVMIGCATGFALFAWTRRFDQVPLFGWLTAATIIIAAVSFFDDRWGLPAPLRLAVHVVAAGVVVFGGGLSIPSIRLPGMGELDLGVAGPAVTIVFITWIANLFNFMDGMDGLAAAMSIIGFVTLALLALESYDYFIVAVSVTIAASVVGFLFFNFPPARIFLGDTGSVPLGFMAGVIAVASAREAGNDIWPPVLVFAPFVADATATLIRRSLQRKRIWKAHREHYYQRLVLAGWTQRRTLAAEIAVMVASAAAAALYAHSTVASTRLIVLVAVLLGYILFAAAVRIVERRAASSSAALRSAF